jgi:phospholipid-binding lipoprotein MlaA
LRWSLWGLDLLDSRARVLSAGDVLNQTFDPYTFSRNAYLQRRQYLVTDGEDSGVEEPPPDVPDDTDSGGTGTDQKAPTPPQDTDKK